MSPRKATAVCIVDETGQRTWRGECRTLPEEIAAVIGQHAGEDVRIGIETGPMTPWLVHQLRCRGARPDRAHGLVSAGAREVVRGPSGSCPACCTAAADRDDNPSLEPYSRRAQDIWHVARHRARPALRSPRRAAARRPVGTGDDRDAAAR